MMLMQLFVETCQYFESFRFIYLMLHQVHNNFQSVLGSNWNGVLTGFDHF